MLTTIKCPKCQGEEVIVTESGISQCRNPKCLTIWDGEEEAARIRADNKRPSNLGPLKFTRGERDLILLEVAEKGVTTVAQNLSIPPSTIYSWRDQKRKKGEWLKPVRRITKRERKEIPIPSVKPKMREYEEISGILRFLNQLSDLDVILYAHQNAERAGFFKGLIKGLEWVLGIEK